MEAFQEINKRVSEYFGKKEISRRSKEIAFQEDMQVLIEDMEEHGLHQGTLKICLVPGKVKKSTGKKQSVDYYQQ